MCYSTPLEKENNPLYAKQNEDAERIAKEIEVRQTYFVTSHTAQHSKEIRHRAGKPFLPLSMPNALQKGPFHLSLAVIST